jgi:hypothetical protein
MNIDKDILIRNDFTYTEFDEKNGGEFTLNGIDEKHDVYFSYTASPEERWYFEAANMRESKYYRAYDVKEITIEDVNTALKLCGINIQLTKHNYLNKEEEIFCERNKHTLRTLYLNRGGSITAIKQIVGEEPYNRFKNRNFIIEDEGKFCISHRVRNYCRTVLELW